MKKTILLISALVFSVSVFTVLQAMGNKAPDPVKTERNSKLIKAGKFKTAKLAVDGMTCTGCERNVTSALEEDEGFIDAEVSFENGEAVVRFDPEKTSAKKLAKVIQDKAGYTSRVASETAEN